MTFPNVHLNGTASVDLLEGYMKAAAAVREASESIALAGPNGRDYYVAGPAAFEAARKEHEARIRKLREVLGELEEIMQNIVEQQDVIDERKRKS